MDFGVGDIRVARNGAWLLERIAETGSVVVKKVGGDRAGEVRAHRFLSSPATSWGQIVQTLGERTAMRCKGRKIIVAQDTTELNFAGRDAKRRGFGPGGNGKDAGFFIHPLVAVDAEDEAVVGILDAEIWTRQEAGEEESVSDRRKRAFEDKESLRWHEGCVRAGELLSEASSIIVVGDRESDIYPVFARRPAPVDLVVRAAQDRTLANGGRLFGALAQAKPLGTMQVKVAPRGIGDKGRLATVEVFAGRVAVARPKNTVDKSDPASIEMTLVEVREVDPPEGAAKLDWRLLTNLPAASLAAAVEIVSCYRLRWRIEQVFRTLKSDGLELEDSQIIDVERFFRLSALALGAAVRIIQLVDARDGSSRPAIDVVDESSIDPIEKIGKSLEGKTERQKNPYKKGELSWLAWIAARLGGWNCYYKPPGPKTMRQGWNRLAAMLEGYKLAQGNALP